MLGAKVDSGATGLLDQLVRRSGTLERTTADSTTFSSVGHHMRGRQMPCSNWPPFN